VTRKPADAPFESWIDARVREARERGEFDDLPGRGRPLPDLAEVADPAWWAKKYVRREGLSALPPALEIRRRVERALGRLASMPSERSVRALVADLNAEIRRLNAHATGGAPTTQPPLDEEEVVARWRASAQPGGR
jgi:hypothetical protein